MPFFRQGDIDELIAETGGVDVVFGATTVKGHLDIVDVSRLEDGASDLQAETDVVTIKTGALPGLVEGSLFSADGVSYRAMRMQRIGDGALTEISVARS